MNNVENWEHLDKFEFEAYLEQYLGDEDIVNVSLFTEGKRPAGYRVCTWREYRR